MIRVYLLEVQPLLYNLEQIKPTTCMLLNVLKYVQSYIGVSLAVCQKWKTERVWGCPQTKWKPVGVTVQGQAWRYNAQQFPWTNHVSAYKTETWNWWAYQKTRMYCGIHKEDGRCWLVRPVKPIQYYCAEDKEVVAKTFISSNECVYGQCLWTVLQVLIGWKKEGPQMLQDFRTLFVCQTVLDCITPTWTTRMLSISSMQSWSEQLVEIDRIVSGNE